MDMEVTAWMSMYNAMNAQQDKRPFSRATLRRILRVRAAAPAAGSSASSCSAWSWPSLAVATPVLAGRVVNAIVDGDDAVRRLPLTAPHRGHRGASRRGSGS